MESPDEGWAVGGSDRIRFVPAALEVREAVGVWSVVTERPARLPVGAAAGTIAGMCDGHEAPRPSVGSAWRNLTAGEGPLPRRLRQLVGNNWWKVRNRQHCCGHYGEPGC